MKSLAEYYRGTRPVWATASPAWACTTVMAGRQATADGSVLMASSCDGDIMGLIYIMPAREYPAGTKLPMYWNVPRPKTVREYQANVRKGYDLVGHLPVEKTYRTLPHGRQRREHDDRRPERVRADHRHRVHPHARAWPAPGASSGPNSNHWTTSLIANGLMRARTAREAIRLIGAMIEQYGFQYYRAPHAGVALPIADDQEVWLMEIFGPGADWTPDSGRPGGVWCAQRIPDGEVGCSANRSRIGRIDLNDPDHFLASPNVFSLARSLGFWERASPLSGARCTGRPATGRTRCGNGGP
jgi:dipeptidase